MIRYLTAGESHGPALVGILEGLPAGVPIAPEQINQELRRRQGGYGRGKRMAIEADSITILSGVRFGLSLGSPIALLIRNRDWENWQGTMAQEGRGGDQVPPSGKEEFPTQVKPVTRPRPGHADLAGGQKYAHQDLRNVLERASARETAMRVAMGALTRAFLTEFGIKVFSYVTSIGGAGFAPGLAPGSPVQGWPGGSASGDESIGQAPPALPSQPGSKPPWAGLDWAEVRRRTEDSPVRCPDPTLSQTMMEAIDQAKVQGDSLGGVFEIRVTGLPPGLGSHVHWDRRLDGRLAAALMGIQAIKGVEIGLGFKVATLPGSQVHDEILYEPGKGYIRPTNNAGGLEGGITNGEDLILRAAMKPIPTLYRPLASVDIRTREPFLASVERSDVCAVPAAAVVGEAVVAFEIAGAFLEKFGGDSLEEVRRNYEAYMESLKTWPRLGDR
ncbi:MAG: chorismate synthase [Firmicutes bacterium]|nr:chorismate synthase [Bacillota bacterium]MCL5038945.1 chorismate synthase [Bacillota bacterium]